MPSRRTRAQTNNTFLRRLLILLAILVLLFVVFRTTDLDPLGLFAEPATPAPPISIRPAVSERLPTTETTTTSIRYRDSWYEVGFVQPIRLTNAQEVEYGANGLPADLLTGSLAERLIAFIDAAKTSIHIATFEIDLSDVAEALIRAHRRGVEVRFITDNEHGIEADQKPGHGQIARLQSAGIPVRSDERPGLMHNKFWIFDSQTVWTGSTNVTVAGMFEQDNNVIVIHSPTLAAIYETEFQEMWDDNFGARAPSTVDQQSVDIQGTPILVLFAPEDKPVQHILPYLQTARQSIQFMAFSFTQPDMGNAMLERIKKGVTVAGVFESVGSDSPYSEMMKLHCAGARIRRDGNPTFLHHKVIVVDERIVITGSLNFSDSANQKNNENVLIIDHPQIAQHYLQEFQRLWEEGQDLDPDRFKCP